MMIDMASSRRYKELIFTNHALERLRQRKVSMGEAWATWKRPKKRTYAATKGAWKCERTWGDYQVEIVAKQNQRKEWVVLSAWSNRIEKRAPSRGLWQRGLRWLWRKIGLIKKRRERKKEERR